MGCPDTGITRHTKKNPKVTGGRYQGGAGKGIRTLEPRADTSPSRGNYVYTSKAYTYNDMGAPRTYNEGDYLQTTEGMFFAVKGSVHPKGLALAILRYVPDPDGERVLSGTRYRRVYDIGSTTEYLKREHPGYINHFSRLGVELQSVPEDRIKQYYDPKKRLSVIIASPKTQLESEIAGFVNTLSSKSGVPAGCFGVSGSILIGLQTADSDIDLNVYGRDNGSRVYTTLTELWKRRDQIKPLGGKLLESVLTSRWGDTGLPLDVFREIETSKVLHGETNGREYFVRLLASDDHLPSKPVRQVTIQARINDASRSMFNPCVYKVTQTIGDSADPTVSELKSYRGKFTEQASEGDLVEVRGTLEEVNDDRVTFHRLILGGKGDYLVPAKDNV